MSGSGYTEPMTKTLKAWLALLRLPNLFTAPGDPLAGALLAGAALGTSIAWVPAALGAVASLCLYACGLVANDALGADEDARERPDRPIPSGRISRGAALIAACLLNACALLAAALASLPALGVAVALSANVWGYNARARALPGVRPFAMGACRGLSLLLGAAAVARGDFASAPVLIAAVGLTLHVAAITAIASREVGPEGGVRLPRLVLVSSPVVLLATLAALALVAWQGWSPSLGRVPTGYACGVTAMAVVWSALWCGLLFGRPGPTAVRRSIAHLVRGILLVQAAFCATAGLAGEAVSLGLLAAFPVASWVGAWIKGS